MTCAPFKQSVLLHAHGQLGRTQAWVVERHLACCPACREEWQKATREASELRGLLGPAVGSAQTIRLTPSQLLSARSERLVNGGRAAGVGIASWLPAGWVQHLGGRFEAGAGRGAGRWLALLVVAALLAGGLAAAATLGPPSNFVQRCLGWPSGGGACNLPTLGNMPANGPGPLNPPPMILPAGSTPPSAQPCEPSLKTTPTGNNPG